MPHDRVLIAANRLPVCACANGTVRLRDDHTAATILPDADSNASRIELVPSSGGLATGLGAWHARTGALWFGWPGACEHATAAQLGGLEQRLAAAGMVPVHLSAEQVTGYYQGFANRVLWPLFHYSLDRVPVDAAGWAAYEDVNQVFADTIASEYRPGDSIWVHDYHLMLLPALLRQRLPHARIGFFLHIPFPSSEVFRVLPWRRAVLNGLLGADLIGFHTFGYMRHFMTSLLHVDGVEPDVDCVHVDGRDVRVGAFPMGVDANALSTLAGEPDVRAQIEAVRRDAGHRRIVLGVDRLDYTKGLPRRLEALAQLLARDPSLRDTMRYVQVAIPSRGDVDSYQQFRREVEELVGRINGTYGTLQSLPIHYVHQSVSARELVALYGAADVMLVTPLRDGMNLVAKEFVASRVDDDGVLVLSELAGAAAELHGAVTVNPYDTQALADSVLRGLTMSVDERRARMRALRRRVLACDVFTWADGFVEQLRAQRAPDADRARRLPARPLSAILATVRRATDVRFLLDYDGTLVPLARSPELAVPDAALLALLDRLASAPGIAVDIVSGRSRESLERWFSDLPIGLWAEHGFWHRRARHTEWHATVASEREWMTRVRPILDQFAASTPGAHVEAKTASLAWHYRESPRDFGTRQAHELRLLLGDLLSHQPVEVLEGKKVIEVRLRGVNKGSVVQRIQADASADMTIVAIGDDRTDEDLFRAVPAGGVSIAVGRSSTAAQYRVSDHRIVRHVLEALIDERLGVRPAADGAAVSDAVSA